MKKVLHVIGSLHIGGSQAFVMNLYRNIDLSQIQFDFVVFQEDRQGFYDEVESRGGTIYTAQQYKGINHIDFVLWWKNFFQQHPEYQVVHGHVRSTASIYLAEAKKQGRYTIAHSHSTSNGTGISKIIKNTLQIPLKYMDNYCFSCSDKAGEWLFGKKKTLDKSKYVVIPNAIDLMRFSFHEQIRRDIKEQYGLQNKFVVGHIGRLTTPKNHKFLIDVFQETKKLVPQAHLLLVGDGELKEELHSYCKQHDLLNDVTFAGAQTETEKYYSAMDVFVFPSLWEGLGIVVIEAQASGLPCILSEAIPQDVAITDLVKYYNLNQNPSEWAAAISQYSTCKRNKLSEDNLNQMKKFDIVYISKEIEKFYLDLMEGNKNATISFKIG